MFGPSQILLRVMIILADVSIVATLWYWAKHRRIKPGMAALYAFLPLSVVESSVGGHIDSIGVAALALSLFLWDTQKFWRSGVLVWCASGIKLVPAVLLLPIWRIRPKYARRITTVFLGLTLVSLWAYSTYPKGLIAFAQKWRGNGGLFAFISWILKIHFLELSSS